MRPGEKMPTVLFKEAGIVKAARGVVGQSLMEVIKEAASDELLAICGGCASCGTCHVYVECERVNDLPAPSEDELELLQSFDTFRPNSRLSCQILLTSSLDGLHVDVVSPF